MKELLENLPKLIITAETYKSLPESAGIYVFFKDKTPIYVGKAINLKRRVSSYFDLDLEIKTAKMVSEANNLSFIKVDSELEALLLESKLIRKYMPKYNVIAKDDKHPLYIAITKEKYPRVIAVRKLMTSDQKLIASYGPFPSSKNVYSVLHSLRRVFPYSDHKLGNRPCLYSHIGLCNPCPNEIEQSTQYKVLREKYLRNIKNLKSILDGNIDHVKRGLEKEMTSLSKEQKYEEASSVLDQIKTLEYITQPQMPTDFYMQNPNLYEDQRNKELSELRKIVTADGIWKLESLERIECFDIAHLAGTNPTASMVTFVNGEADKTFYRHFKIKKAKGGDDYGSLAEVARRRINHLQDWGKPDLMIIDGGLGQVKSFTSILYSNKVNIPVVGIAKHPDRLIIGTEKIRLKGPALNLVQRIRDEAHRFARVYHHKLISKAMTG